MRDVGWRISGKVGRVLGVGAKKDRLRDRLRARARKRQPVAMLMQLVAEARQDWGLAVKFASSCWLRITTVELGRCRRFYAGWEAEEGFAWIDVINIFRRKGQVCASPLFGADELDAAIHPQDVSAAGDVVPIGRRYQVTEQDIPHQRHAR